MSKPRDNNEYEWKTVALKLRILKRDKWICQLCLEEIKSIRDFSIDHKKPRVKNGTDDFENLQASHAECNNVKGHSTHKLTPAYYRKRRQEKIKRGNGKVRRGKRIKEQTVLCRDERGIDWCQMLYDEIAKKGFENISYKSFSDHVKKYHLEKERISERIKPIPVV